MKVAPLPEIPEEPTTSLSRRLRDAKSAGHLVRLRISGTMGGLGGVMSRPAPARGAAPPDVAP